MRRQIRDAIIGIIFITIVIVIAGEMNR